MLTGIPQVGVKKWFGVFGKNPQVWISGWYVMCALNKGRVEWVGFDWKLYKHIRSQMATPTTPLMNDSPVEMRRETKSQNTTDFWLFHSAATRNSTKTQLQVSDWIGIVRRDRTIWNTNRNDSEQCVNYQPTSTTVVMWVADPILL